MTPEQRKLFKQEFGEMTNEEIMEQLREWHDEGGCEAACSCGAWIEPDGTCEHDQPSWLRALGWI